MGATVNEPVLLEILEKLHVSIYIADEDGALRYINAAASRLDRLDKKRDIGRKVADIWNVNAFEALASPTLDTLKTGKIHYCDNLEWHLADGTRVNAITSSYPIMRDGRIAGVFTLSEDVDGLKRHLIKQGAFKRKQFFRLRPELLKNGTDYVLDDIIGQSEVTRNAVALARRFAGKKMPVLLYGETGTGKEMFAQGIHNASSCAAGCFVAVNCAAIPETLLESILFGTVKGAYTGATDKEGLFEKADRGTIFLDEINSMPPALQAKLLRAIQEKEIQRLGATKTRRINCRIISATNKEPLEAIEAGELREDLYYRLAMGIVWIPPLRDRGGDLEELVSHYISKANEEMDTVVFGASEALMRFFKTYDWPGNVRELANVISNAVIMANDGDMILDVDHISKFMRKAAKPSLPADEGRRPEPWPVPGRKKAILPMGGNIDETVDAYEETLLRLALSTARGQVGKAAGLLGITRQSLYVKLKKYKINKDQYI